MDYQKKDSLWIQGSYPIIWVEMSRGQRPSWTCSPAASNQDQSAFNISSLLTAPREPYLDIFIMDSAIDQNNLFTNILDQIKQDVKINI